ncbi:DUF6503 family protein [Flavobacterium sp.]|uniref:DUF6503 family protein n=1 Tax=Flavobacterium sp. TaxID=239 RepID=UPI002620DB6A|nr:DUF6503 family protein [Flavobacterium sp.]MDG2431135.1 hypothetical protein [Flavobacterium sp.]
MKTTTLLLLFTILFSSCQQRVKNISFTDRVAKAHLTKDFLQREAIQFDLKLEFGGTDRINAKMTLLTNSSKAVIAYSNGAKIIIDQNKVFYSPSIPNKAAVRFDAYTWSYFFLFPYKVNDPGTIWTAYANTEKNNKNYLTEKLTFASGTGDAPDDWYVVYANAKSNLIEKAAYIVTLKSDKEEAEKNPHVIQYLDYKKIDGIPIATKWIFNGWQEGKGLTDELGHATLSNIQFIKVDPNYFEPGADFKTI